MSTLRGDRERAIAVLSDHFAQDHLDVDEFERRVTGAHNAQTGAELVALMGDLPAPPTGALAKVAPAASVVPAAQVQRKRTVLAILSGAQFEGQWLAPRKLRVIAVMGGASLDFRDARLPPGVTEVVITAVMGGVEIIVPPGLAVDVAGSAIMGGFDHVHRMSAEAGEELPLLRVHGFCVMGGVVIETRLPGESEGDARRRRRRERREARSKLRDGNP
ncbi:MAG TPA: DUF1707 domain-containing protein [Polyangia bacterium]|nr:DUF1707 domain-containing protein [Polyangia bacterium]